MNRRQAEQLRQNNRHWKLGTIYVCKADPRIIVRNRWILGWAWNFGHPHVWIILLIVMAIVIAPLSCTTLFSNVPPSVLVAIYTVMLIVVIAAANYIANGPR